MTRTGATARTADAAWVAPDPAATDEFPHPTTTRWQPLRLGLVDLFYYDDEQFWFHDGRLLLRGNNGTGKSKVLALTLPFLLDGAMAARRVEPDADPKKRMDWNLLLGGAHPSSERTGYAWAEFGRVDDDGTERFLTIGIGLKAAAGRGLVRAWFFTATRRVGDLRLIDGDGIVLTEKRLAESLGETHSGHVYTSQGAYRDAIDESLFRLGHERYAALIDLLIQLRQPQLAKKPDEKALSAALTEALTPLDQALVSDVAESFRSLEEERTGIEVTRETLGAARDFLRHYRAYARVAARRRCTAVRETNSTYERAGRNLRDTDDALGSATASSHRLEQDRDELDRRRSGIQGELRALQESAVMADAKRLDEADAQASDMERRTGDAHRELVEAQGGTEREAAAASAAERRHGEARARADESHRSAVIAAEKAGLADQHDALLRDENRAHRALARRQEQVEHIRGLITAAAAAADRAEQSKSVLDSAESESSSRAERRDRADAALAHAIADYQDGAQRFVDGLRLIGAVGDLTEEIGRWARSLTGRSPLRAAVDAASEAVLVRIGGDLAAAQRQGRQLSADLDTLRRDIDELERGRDPEPPPSPGRDADGRAERAGAPLWRVTDFRPAARESERAALEAALASSGLIDAWISADGTLTVGDDVVLGPSGPTATPSLADLLVPAVGPDAPIEAAAVTSVLARVGLGEASGAPLWVDADGNWGAGPVRGSWHKSGAEYIGAGARLAHRQRRIAALRTRERELAAELAAAVERVAAATRQQEDVAAERARYPDDAERHLLDADRQAIVAAHECARAEEKVAEARERAAVAVADAARVAAELTDTAAGFRLGSTEADLRTATAAIADYGRALVTAGMGARQLAEAELARDQTQERARAAATLEARREREWTGLRDQAVELRSRFVTLQATVGASVAELQRALERARTERNEIAEALARNGESRIQAAAGVAELTEKRRGLEERRGEASVAREEEVGRLRMFAGTGLLGVAVPDVPVPDAASDEEWTVTAALACARGAEQHLGDVDESDPAWSRAQQRVSTGATELITQMSKHGHTAFTEQHHEVLVVRVRYRGDDVPVDRLVDRLTADIADRERILSAREREILENHLVNEVANHLHELLLAAVGQIDEMNRELARRTTSTGMQLRVRWRERPDGPAGLVPARELMLRSDATWTTDDRSAIGEFLQAQIAEARLADPSGSWAEHLGRALDYRRWHAFAIERRQHGQWRPASGPASGGERALAASVPLFAAAAAHYNSADPLAPRLILLDEAFAGIDDDSRAKSLGLLATFDLDVVMTSEREWGCYPQVPGLSIAQLARVDGVDAVGVTRWRWDGRRRERMGEIASVARASAPAAPSPPPDDVPLFG